MIIDLFSGARGWEAASDVDAIGFELDRDAARTSAAAGYKTVRCDLFDYPIPTGRVEGVIGSPPCQPFSRAGKRDGMSALVDVVRHIDTCQYGWHEPEAEWRRDPRIGLVVEPLRWALTKVPEWCAWEQVPDVLPVWEACARVLRAQGWSVWTGCLSAEQYGVAQTRERAFLIASRTRTVQPPEPTHQEYRPGQPAELSVGLFGEVLPWVSMADALGWGFVDFGDRECKNGCIRQAEEPAPTICAAHDNGNMRFRVGFPRLDDQGTSPDGYRERDWRSDDEPAFAVTEKARSWILQTNRGQDDDGSRQTRDTTAPAPTFSASAGGQWCFERPATTVVGSFRPDVIAGPGYRGPGDGPRQNAPGSVKITLEDALVLQSFPADWPLQGTKTSKFRQVGNAVPPLLAAAVLRSACG